MLLNKDIPSPWLPASGFEIKTHLEFLEKSSNSSSYSGSKKVRGKNLNSSGKYSPNLFK